MTVKFTAYIDEAGDEGIGQLDHQGAGGQSRWLILGGIIVRDEADKALPKWRDEVMGLFPNKQSRQLHFRNLVHEQRVAACGLLSQKNFQSIAVCSNKITLTYGPEMKRRFSQKGFLYNYLTRYLLERLTAFVRLNAECQTQGAALKVVFSRRHNTDYNSMREYLCLLRDGREKVRPVRTIDWTVFDPDNIEVEDHSRRAGLQIADICTSAILRALEKDRYGYYEPRYALMLGQTLLKVGGARINWGLTLVPKQNQGPLDTSQKDFLEKVST